MRGIERERQRHRQREKQAPCREPDAGLDPGSPGLRPGPKAGAKPLRHPGIPINKIFIKEVEINIFLDHWMSSFLKHQSILFSQYIFLSSLASE